MTDNDRLFGPLRAARLTELHVADHLRLWLNTPPDRTLLGVPVHVRAHAGLVLISSRSLRGYRQ